MSLKLEMPVVRELLSREEIHVAEAPSDSPGMATAETTVESLSACCRLVDLLRTPQDVPFLTGLIEREIIYRVLRSAEGARLRAIATLGDQSHRTAKAISWIRTNYAKPLRVEDLAEIAGMGVSTLHHPGSVRWMEDLVGGTLPERIAEQYATRPGDGIHWVPRAK